MPCGSRRATAHAADPRFHGNLRHEEKNGAKKKVRFFGWGGLSGRVRFEVSSVGCVYGFLDSFWGVCLGVSSAVQLVVYG